jgi:hypothetical protein
MLNQIRGPNVIYDFRVAPCTYDFAQFMSIAKCYVNEKFPGEQVSLWLYRPYFRLQGPIETADYYAKRLEERFKNIILAMIEEVNFIKNVQIIQGESLESMPHTFDFPPGYRPCDTKLQPGISLMPCSLIYLSLFKDRDIDPRIFFRERVDFNECTYDISISLRNSPQKPERASNLDLYFQLYERLKDRGEKIIVVPDYDDSRGSKEYLKYDWTVAEHASISIHERLRLYCETRLNILSPAGWNVLAYLGRAPYLILGYLCRSDPIGNISFHLRKGPEPYKQLFWSMSDQRIDWSDHEDLTLDYIEKSLQGFHK